MAANVLYSDYQSVVDALPLDDGKFYDVICIVLQDDISQGYSYRMGKYSNGFFFINDGMFSKKNDFRCDWRQQKIIAWKPLEMASPDKIHEFYEKAGR